MREVLARSDHDFRVYDSAPAKPRGRARGQAGGQTRGGRAKGAKASRSIIGAIASAVRPIAILKIVAIPLVRKPATALTALLMTSCAVFIVVNAVALQPGQHPAPLFGSDRGRAAPETAQRPVASTTPAPPVPAPPQRVAAPTAPAAVQPPNRPERAAPAPRETAAALPPARPDVIGDFIRGGAPATTGAINTTPQASLVLLNAQKALLKLGYVIKPDGLMGPATQKAIEIFEKDHGLAVTGELGPRTLQALGAASGMPVE
ncbi:MAG: peptidoglycan-binding protein [Chelatococcus sp.]|uniref:peptidoglycan-binding domain-containing protein n=1 Tax=Chelatococcus sp. TaxID=1953771 RepID=UPI0025C3EF4A|nr:peptidoglycan-binding domain-containing protein [Chelatococcus sp.]MBX3537367.1 peptidoglycan-binding protein [Chelatococcus sp.]